MSPELPFYDAPRPWQKRRQPKAKSVAMRSIGLSAADEARLKSVQAILQAGPDDVPSFSLVFRRSLELYASRVLAMRYDPSQLQAEKFELKAQSRLPRARRKGQPRVEA
jgi:hypothetical protein